MDEGWACAVTVKGGDPSRLTGPPDQRRKPKPCTFSSSLPPRLDGTEIKFVPSGSATQRRPDELSLCGFVLARLATDWKRGLARVDPSGRADLIVPAGLPGLLLSEWQALARSVIRPAFLIRWVSFWLESLQAKWDKIKSKKLKFLPLLQWP